MHACYIAHDRILNLCESKTVKLNDLSIRIANENDADEIRRIYRDTIMSVNSKDYSPEQTTAWAAAADEKNTWLDKIRDQYFLTAIVKGEIAGFGSVTKEGYIDFMFVRKDLQGLGIATELLSRLESFARSGNIARIWAEVSITARPFFRARGFEITERFVKTVNNISFDDCIMTKQLLYPPEIRIIAHDSEEYMQELELRNRILRIPLGLDVYEDDLSKEGADHHIGAFLNGELAGVLVLTRIDDRTLKMRQVAVDEHLQGKGIGKILVEFSEALASREGFEKIVMNARLEAVPFYEKLGYEKEGGMFIEVTIPHYKLSKILA